MLVSKFFELFYFLQTDVASGLNNPTIIVGLVGVASIVFGAVYLLNQKKTVELETIMSQTQLLQNKATDFGETALDKIDDVLDEYQKILPYLEDLGLKVEGLSIEVGLLPKIQTSLVASLDVIEVEAVERVKTENKTNKLLVSILNAVLLAKKCNDRLDEASISLFKDIVVDIALGIPPGVSVRFR
jgi:hypothetical protein